MGYNSENPYAKRKHIIALIAVLVMVVYISRLFYLQILSPQYREFADSNAFLRKTLYPARGANYYRNGQSRGVQTCALPILRWANSTHSISAIH